MCPQRFHPLAGQCDRQANIQGVWSEARVSGFHPLAGQCDRQANIQGVWSEARVSGFHPLAGQCDRQGKRGFLKVLIFKVSIPLRGNVIGKSSLLESLLSKDFRYPIRHQFY